MGRTLQKNLDDLIAHLKVELPKAFESKEHEQSLNQIVNESQEIEQQLYDELQKSAEEKGFLINATKVGISLIPIQNGQRMGLFVVGAMIDEMQERYRDYPAVVSYLEDVQNDILKNIEDFVSSGERPLESALRSQSSILNPEQQQDPFSKYRINVLVDNTGVTNPPIILETNPTYLNLIGRIERRPILGTLVTDFTMIKAGSLVNANGGYLVLNACDLFTHFGVWDALKRVIKNIEIRIEDLSEQFGIVPIMGLKPQPLPYDGKIILVGNLSTYHFLYAVDEDFRKIFKVKADFDSQMPLDTDHMNAYANFVAARCQEE